jgi:putative membrane protein
MNDSHAADFFTPGERERIRLAVASAEHGTSGEIATMVVARSDSYREAITLGSVLGAGFVALIVAVASHHVTIWTYVPLTLLLYFPCRLLVSRVAALQRPFITGRRIDESVRERAVRAFYEKGLYRTRQETGILIFISLFERKVWILGDRGINARIAPESWQRLAATLSAGIRDGRGCDALCEVIASCGEELSRHFPRGSDDTNELADELLT